MTVLPQRLENQCLLGHNGQVIYTSNSPLVAIAVRDHGTSERLMRELRSRIAGAELATIACDRALRDALLSPTARCPDVLILDASLATLVTGFELPELMPLVAVLIDSGSTEPLPEDVLNAGFSPLRLGSEPRPFSEVAIWTAGAISALVKGRAENSENIQYGRRYEDLMHALPDIVYELDIEGTITFVNDSISLLGYLPADLVGKHYSILLYEEDASAVDRDKVLPDFIGYKTGFALSPKLFNERRGIDRRTTDLEVRLKRKPGSTGGTREVIGSIIAYGEISSAGEYERGDKSQFKGTVGIIRDVTLRRKSEEMLRKLYQAVDQLGSCAFVLNHAFEVEYVNPAFFMLTGFSPPEVIGQNVYRFFAFMPEKVDRLSRRVQDGFESREEVLVPRAAGGQFWADFTMAPVRSPSGAITHAIAIVEDISSRKSMEELLRNARRDAEEANRTKSRFLSSMTHELKHTAGTILSAARTLKADDGEPVSPAMTISVGAQALFDALSGILDYVRSENSGGSLHLLSFPLASFMERSCARYRNIAEAKGLEFLLRVESDETVESDSDRLGRVIEILVDNAVRYTDRGSVTVDAAIDRQDGNVPHLLVRITDTGSGLAVLDQKTIFNPFPVTDKAGGKAGRVGGIGLALARNIIMVLGGEIRLESRPGAGSVFSVVVPAASPVKAPVSTRSQYTVLVVDDNEVNLDYMKTLIENCGHRVHCASGAAEAFRVLETRYVDAALLDIQMPGYSGTELAKAIRAYAGHRYSSDMPLFAITAQDRTAIEDADRLFMHVFPKPADMRQFSSALRAVMEERETIPTRDFAEKVGNHPALLARTRLEVESALSALTLALSGKSDVRIDIRAEAAILGSALRRFSSKPGQELVTMFIEHYAGEDKITLACVLERIGAMLRTALDEVQLMVEGTA